jgi:aryl-alcohol dehydrogenase-like predicted oxidoreductase|tara:strand:+ start:1866 stop:2750 length:885 start_codon:yes stop_codon:yes gene_type:complete
MKKLALGTAQFGMSYGIANQHGKIKLENIKDIIKIAREKNIDLVDTAIAYGDSERIIGKIGILDFKFVTKLPPLPKIDVVNISFWVEDQIKLSLKRLGIQSLYGLLIHRSEDLLGDKGEKIVNALNNLKARGLVKKIGISIYDLSELEKLTNQIKVDIVQAPLNIIDQRLINSGWLSKLYKADVEVHIRSVFLQGLLLMSKQNRPHKFNRWKNLWKIWHEWLNDNQITALEATIRYALSVENISKVIVGVDSKKQLQQIILASDGKLPPIPPGLFMDDINLLNPSNWNKIQKYM